MMDVMHMDDNEAYHRQDFGINWNGRILVNRLSTMGVRVTGMAHGVRVSGREATVFPDVDTRRSC